MKDEIPKENKETSREQAGRMVRDFESWLEKVGYSSYDPYDIWGTRFGLFSRKVYYENQFVGLPLIAPILALEVFAPSLRSLFVKKNRYPTADAQLLLSFLNLYLLSGNTSYLNKAMRLGKDLLNTSIPGYTGHCWGYPFDWQNNSALWKKNTPYITATPYCFESFLGLYRATGDKEHLDVALSAAHFVFEDLKDTPISPDGEASSYSPIDNSKVVNASAYRAMVLFKASELNGRGDYLDKAQKNLNFILNSQNRDGSWFYGIGNKKGAFIDHFHTCFVLKNLYKIYKMTGDARVMRSVKLGYQYYRNGLFDGDDLPLAFSIKPRIQIIKHELYNYAEAITLGSLLNREFDDALPLAKKLVVLLHSRFRHPEGHFMTRVYAGNIKHTTPFLRWPQSQLFYSLTNFLAATNQA